MPERSEVFAISPDVSWRAVDGDVVIVSAGSVVLVNAPGGEVWSLIDGRRTRAEIEEEMTTRYPGTEVADDCDKLLGALVGAGLVVELAPRDDVYALAPDLAWVLDGEHVLIHDLQTHTRSGLSVGAGLVFEAVAEGASLTEILDAYAGLEDHRDENTATQIKTVAQALVESGLLLAPRAGR